MRAWAVVAAFLVACSSPPSAPEAPSPLSAQDEGVDVQGHRGARGLEPENSIVAMRRALALGVTTLELDVGVTADGVVVVHHDERLNPDTTRDADGRFIETQPALLELTYAELATYDVGRLRPGSAYAARFPTQAARDGTRIPRLVDLLAITEAESRATIRYNIETKLSPDHPERTLAHAPFAAALAAVLRKAGVMDRTVVQSFDWRTLRILQQEGFVTSCLTAEEPGFDTVQRSRPGPSPWTAGLDVDDHGSVPALVAAAGCRVWSPNHAALDGATLADAHRLGLSVAVWTVNDPTDIDAMLRLGVDAIISDYPDRVLDALARPTPSPR